MSLAVFSAIALPPPFLLLFELIATSVIIGLTPSNSWARQAILPVLLSCTYLIVQSSSQYMRPRWASLLGGFSFTLVLQYIDLALLSHWNYEDRGPPIQNTFRPEAAGTPSLQPLWERFAFGWNAMWSFRHVNSPHEVKNVPPFSTNDPNYVPSKRRFVLQQSAAALGCYIMLDLLGARKPPANSAEIFNPDLIPMISRIGEVSAAELKLRALTIAGFGLTFYCVIQGFQSLAAGFAVGSGLSDAANWRPAFGSLSESYSLKNFWGKVWHQLLRRPLTSVSSSLVHGLLCIPQKSLLGGTLTLILSFALSGALHTAAGVASGMSLAELGVFRFFCTQALGVIIEQAAIAAVSRSRGKELRGAKPPIPMKMLGYAWVAVFMAWSGPAWIYPQAARAPAKGATSFLPFSILGLFNSHR
ncbi:membrane bound O-acyl transferase family-domain-containing protein [Lophiotrema nucula]|uniref:Membrane bound O-acyl transferase family-domain-containing protein n=1 Tax=Lophiotrema nucula TaxID=690887 RepID=A0A6A5ZCC3_9PLEO|nr:membrane bound O-acyl transferase family-domain-containing protein [Lophiotrema nucula]